MQWICIRRGKVWLQNRNQYNGWCIHIAADFGKTKKFNLPTFITFIDYEKVYDNLIRERLRQIVMEEDVPTQLLKATHSLYRNSKICLKYNPGQISESISTNRGVRQDCELSRDLFNI
jgi:hypothetical protein